MSHLAHLRGECSQDLEDKVLELNELKSSITKGTPVPMGSTRKRPDISEVFSPPRVTKMAQTEGLTAGVALDLRTCDGQGRRWDFEDSLVQRRALDLVRSTQPRLLIGSPECTAFSALQNLSKHKRDPTVVQDLYKRACRHIEFCTLLYGEQLKRGDLFVHEHPSGASSWKLP